MHTHSLRANRHVRDYCVCAHVRTCAEVWSNSPRRSSVFVGWYGTFFFLFTICCKYKMVVSFYFIFNAIKRSKKRLISSTKKFTFSVHEGQ